MKSRFILMADGASSRWTGKTPKHLIEVHGEPILKRTVRLLKENNQDDIIITSHNPDYNFAERYEPVDNDYEIDRYLACLPIWKDSICFLYGDVYYTESAIKKIVETKTKDIIFFGRKGKNKVKAYGEIFAVKCNNPSRMKIYCEKVKQDFIAGRIKRNIGWDLFRALGRRGFIDLEDDLVEDFDKVEDYNNWKQAHGNIL